MAKINVPRFKPELGFTTTEKRSSLMSKIRSTQTKPEIILRKALWRQGLRYRINYKKLPGSPDIVFNKKKIAVFVDGEFWHGHKWEIKKDKIKTNREFWIPKIERNIQRDKENKQALLLLGYTVLRFWENEIRKNLQECANKVLETYILA